jgi:hypothetical protein
MTPLTASDALDFEGLGRTLELLDGEQVQLGLAYTRSAGQQLLGGISGTLHLWTEQQAADAVTEVAERLRADGLAHLLEVDGFKLAVFSGALAEASYLDRVLRIRCGPMMITIDATGGQSDA